MNISLRWKIHEVAKIPHGYQVAVADVDLDGRPDILGLSSEESIVAWYKNPTWEAHNITTRTEKNISLAPLVSKGSGFSGLALATDFQLEESTSGGHVWWATPPPSPNVEWGLDPIGKIPTSHRLRWADLYGDGGLQLIDAPIVGAGARRPEYKGGAPVTWFERAPGGWVRHLIDDSLTVVHGLNVLDWDGDGRDEILAASFEGVHLFHSSGSRGGLHWTKRHLAAGDQESRPARGSSEIGVGRVGGRRFLATIEPWHGDSVVVYLEPPRGTAAQARGQLWERHVIDSSFREGHALACADLDADGNDEIVAGYRGPGTSLYLFRAADSSLTNWERQPLDTQMAASGLAIADVNGDGLLDVVAIGASTGNLKWYENAK